MRQANHKEKPSTTWVDVGNFDVDLISYDLNGNIETLKRKNSVGTMIDNLTYNYTETVSGNKLQYVNDNGTTDGFLNGNSSGTDYFYDENGNMILDKNKHIKIDYNYLNLPKRVYPEGTGSDEIKFIYDASGTKWQKVHTASSSTTTMSYCNNFIYDGAVGSMELDKVLHAEGIIDIASSSHSYHYFLKDHLGNTRITLSDANGNGVFDNDGNEILQWDDYYPFGMSFDNTQGGDNKYLYNGKELQDEQIGGVNLDWYDYGFRFYDPALGRFPRVDPLAETYVSWSPYHYAMNNPIRFTDILGMGAGDFYDERGKFLGTDGIDDGRIYVVTDKQEKKEIRQTNKQGGTTSVSDVSSATELPSAFVRGEMGKAVDRAGSPSFHEEGGFFGTKDGQEYVAHAEPGEDADPSSDDYASINPYKAASKAEYDKASGGTIDGSFHTHPDGTVTHGNVTSSFENEPSNAVNKITGQPMGDIPNARENRVGATGNHYVLAQGNKTVYIYNGGGTVAKFPFKKFFSIGINK